MDDELRKALIAKAIELSGRLTALKRNYFGAVRDIARNDPTFAAELARLNATEIELIANADNATIEQWCNDTNVRLEPIDNEARALIERHLSVSPGKITNDLRAFHGLTMRVRWNPPGTTLQ